MSLRLSVLLLAFSMVLVAGNARALVLFDETFARTTTGKATQVRTFNADAGVAVIVFTNSNGATFDRVKQGKIVLNGEVVFGTQDFKVNGAITKTVALAAGSNTLVIELSGPSGGQMSVSVRQGPDQPVLTFPQGTIYVSTLGTDSAICGVAKDTACRTIGQGLQRAAQTLGPLVAVAGGFYPENISLVSGINVLGGFDDEFSRHHIPSLRAMIRGEGTNTATVLASGVNAPTMFEGFFVLGPTMIRTPTLLSANSYGILVRDSTSSLVIQNNVIVGGVGGIGDEGGTFPPGNDGAAGEPGMNAGALAVPGGQGGFSFPGPGGTLFVGGGRGGNSGTPVYNVRNGPGFAGAGLAGGPAGAAGGLGGFNGRPLGDCSTVLFPTNGPIDGFNAFAGGTGANGSGGSGGIDGALANNTWGSAFGASGTPGRAGSGGGGGGAGGGVAADASLNCAAVFGPSGGGGGSGASGGGQGSGGRGGGAAFGIFISLTDSASKPVIGANQIYLGIGARGGNGGSASFGGFGGAGGLAGNPSQFPGTGTAGRGGNGGNGGHGGGGGGGAGGMSAGIAATFQQLSYETDNDIFTEGGMAGAGGSGGMSVVSPGQDGHPGELAAVRWLGP